MNTPTGETKMKLKTLDSVKNAGPKVQDIRDHALQNHNLDYDKVKYQLKQLHDKKLICSGGRGLWMITVRGEKELANPTKRRYKKRQRKTEAIIDEVLMPDLVSKDDAFKTYRNWQTTEQPCTQMEIAIELERDEIDLAVKHLAGIADANQKYKDALIKIRDIINKAL